MPKDKLRESVSIEDALTDEEKRDLEEASDDADPDDDGDGSDEDADLDDDDVVDG